MKTLDMNKMEQIEGGNWMGCVGAGVAAGGLALAFGAATVATGGWALAGVAYTFATAPSAIGLGVASCVGS